MDRALRIRPLEASKACAGHLHSYLFPLGMALPPPGLMHPKAPNSLALFPQHAWTWAVPQLTGSAQVTRSDSNWYSLQIPLLSEWLVVDTWRCRFRDCFADERYQNRADVIAYSADALSCAPTLPVRHAVTSPMFSTMVMAHEKAKDSDTCRRLKQAI